MNDKYSKILLVFLTISNQIKLYHWQTKIYSRHIATDNLVSNLNNLIDEFIETLMGRLIIEKNDKTYRILYPENNSIKLSNFNDDNGNEFIKKIKSYLEDIEFLSIIENMTDLLNIKDEMLGIINKTGYLFSLS